MSRNENLDTILEGIARNILFIETLKTRRSDELDFHEVSVRSLREALRVACELGQQSK